MKRSRVSWLAAWTVLSTGIGVGAEELFAAANGRQPSTMGHRSSGGGGSAGRQPSSTGHRSSGGGSGGREPASTGHRSSGGGSGGREPATVSRRSSGGGSPAGGGVNGSSGNGSNGGGQGGGRNHGYGYGHRHGSGCGHGYGYGYGYGYGGYGYAYLGGPYYWGWGYPYPYNWYWGGGWGPAAYYSSGYSAQYRGYGDETGALDLDVAPEKAEIYIDGQMVGRADDFDGFPTYLWLPEGTYDVVIYKDGFQTIARQYTVYPGLVIDVEDRMQPGEAVRPEQLMPRSTVNRDARLRRESERQAEAGSMQGEDSYEDEPWRVRRERADAEREQEAAAHQGGNGEEVTRASDAIGLRLRVDPADAAVYLNGRFLGEANRAASSLWVSEGSHTLELVRPGYRTTTRTFSAKNGDALTFDLKMEAEH